MKKILLLLMITFLFVSCDSSKKKKKKFVYLAKEEISTQTEPKTAKKKPTNEVLIDLNNKGIGPVKNLSLGDINQDMVAKGKALYKSRCTACHGIDRKLVGPALKGISQRRSPEWIMNFIINPGEMLKKDPIAKKLLEIYKAQMVSMGLTEQQSREVLEYLRTL